MSILYKYKTTPNKFLADYYKKALKFMYETGNIELVNIRGCPFRAVPKGEITLKQRKQAPNSSDLPVYLFKQGNNQEAYRYFGAHLEVQDGVPGAVFRVWAPHAKAVAVVGDFNSWVPGEHTMHKVTDGIWELFIPGIKEYDIYKYCITTASDELIYKSDPYAFHTETRPSNGSKVYDIEGYAWGDDHWTKESAKRDVINSPMSIYEMQAGSWKMKDAENGTPYNYAELADELISYIKDMGYTHVELLPITEYPFDGSWGYQVTGYFAPTSRYGTPKDLMAFVDKLHAAGIGVIMDWVPAHFPKDQFGLYRFDGEPCYEDPNPKRGEHKEWGTMVFDFGRSEVQSFLISSALYWLEQYHIDGLRVDAVAAMLYLDYGRREYHPNKFGGKENLEAIAFLRKLNRAVFSVRRSAITAAEESTAFPLVTKPDYDGGLGFLFKWNMGWMNDMLHYMSLDPLFRKGSHNDLTFSMTYAYSENFILPLSHDEVVHGKCSLINKMPGEYDDKFSNLRVFYGFMMGHPGKKLSFMGNEFAQFIEWNYAQQLDWLLLDYERHRQMQDYVRDLNHFYLDHSSLWNNDSDWNGFQWISADDRDNSVIAFRRIDRRGCELIVICNFCPVTRTDYRLGLPKPGEYEAVFNSDEVRYGGKGTELPVVTAEKEPLHGLPFSGSFTLAPLSVAFYRKKTAPRKKTAKS